MIPSDEGKQGVPGDSGDTGERGPSGDHGQTGLTGRTGASGERGATGIPGERGKTGDLGPRGSQGLSGQVGMMGIQGIVGERGATGDHGQAGDQGHVGQRGATGVQGQPGPRGPHAPPVLSRLQTLALFLFVVICFVVLAYRAEANRDRIEENAKIACERNNHQTATINSFLDILITATKNTSDLPEAQKPNAIAAYEAQKEEQIKC